MSGPLLSRVGVLGLPCFGAQEFPALQGCREEGKAEQAHPGSRIAKGPVLSLCVGPWGEREKGRDGALKPWDSPDLLLPRLLGT